MAVVVAATIGLLIGELLLRLSGVWIGRNTDTMFLIMTTPVTSGG